LLNLNFESSTNLCLCLHSECLPLLLLPCCACLLALLHVQSHHASPRAAHLQAKPAAAAAAAAAEAAKLQ
jgi:hypothetical protein